MQLYVLKSVQKKSCCHFLWPSFKVKKIPERTRAEKKFFLQTLKEPPFFTPTSYFELRSRKLHYRLGFNKKTLVGDALNDQRLPHWEIVEKWPIYFPSSPRLPKWISFPPVQLTAHCRWVAARGQSKFGEQRSAVTAGKQPRSKRDKKDAVHKTRPAVGAIFHRGASVEKIRIGSEGGQSRSSYRFIPGL